MTSADFHISLPSCAQISVCRVEVSNLLLLGCKETDKCKEKLLGMWEFTAPEAEVLRKPANPSPRIPGEFVCIPRSTRFDPATFWLHTL